MADGTFSRPRTFDDYLRSYRDDHQHPVNRLCHMIGVPMIVASLPLIPTVPPVGVSLFGVGWGFQFVGHAFEGKKPSFARDLRYLAIGPVWAAIEWTELVTGKKFYELPETEPKPTF
ncbi:MAG: DUF962 domain-containing protein [Polyangiaceae bacterium]